MISRLGSTFLVTLLLCLPAVAQADDLSGADRILCTAVQVTHCTETGECATDLPWNLNVPQFIEVDLGAKTLATTAASGENRATPIAQMYREEGLIVLQGLENGRAFSFMISEQTGAATVAVARQGLAVSVFGACTPLAGE